MLYLVHMLTVFQLCVGLLPVAVSVYAVRIHSFALACFSVVAVYIVIATLPLYRHRESLWVFFWIFLTTIPINIMVVYELLTSWFFKGALLLTNIIRGYLIFFILFSLEELVCGLIARIIWKRQYKAVLIR